MGTKEGGLRARDKNYELYGSDFYRRAGHIGGSRRVPKGFALNRELAAKCGAIGGRISRRPKKVVA